MQTGDSVLSVKEGITAIHTQRTTGNEYIQIRISTTEKEEVTSFSSQGYTSLTFGNTPQICSPIGDKTIIPLICQSLHPFLPILPASLSQSLHLPMSVIPLVLS